MFDLKNAMQAASSGMRAQSLRMRLVGENIANTDTPGYRRKVVSFVNEIDRAQGTTVVRPGPISLSEKDPIEAYEPGHPLADARGIVVKSNVNPLIEIADAREAQRSYQANLSIFDQARTMRAGLLDLIRR